MKNPKPPIAITQYPKFIIGLLLLSVFMAGCSPKPEQKKSAPVANTVYSVPVDGKIVNYGTLKEELELVGTLVANQEVNIASELTRKIVSVNVKEGSLVKKGALLFKLDDADLQAQLERLRQQEKLATLNEQRLNDLIKHDAAIQEDYDQAFTNLKVLEAQIHELQVMISKTRIQAPFNGQIGIINVHPGAIVSTNTILTNIQDNSVVKVEFQIPEKYSNLILPGSEQTFTVASDEKQYSSKVVAREASLNQNTRTLLVRSIAENPGGKLLAGQSARIKLSLNSTGDALTVSSNALIPSSLGYNVYVSKNNKANLQHVEIGQRTSDLVEITKGLNNGDTVVTSNLLRLSPNASIQFVSLK